MVAVLVSVDTTRLSDDIYRWSNEVKCGANLHFRKNRDNDVTALTPLVSYVTADDF